jgi:hypothetical protein
MHVDSIVSSQHRLKDEKIAFEHGSWPLGRRSCAKCGGTSLSPGVGFEFSSPKEKLFLPPLVSDMSS